MAILFDLDAEAHRALRLLDDHPAPWLPDADGLREAKAVTIAGRYYQVLRGLVAASESMTRYESTGAGGWVIWLDAATRTGRVQVDLSGHPGDLAFDLFILSLYSFGEAPFLGAPARAAAA